MADAMTGKGAERDPMRSTPAVAPSTTGAERDEGTRVRGTTPGGVTAKATPLFPHDESDKFELQLQHAVAGFVDGPRAAVEEADRVLEELTARFTEAVTQRRRTLRGAWQSADRAEGGPESSTDTEQLRLALRDYRELAERLLHG
ncbi:hypothetical protein ACFYNL_08120 [Streptomyces sp. NPDC007808]|uniref:hypothetical protein n=1 Tax=Streptomyces sp. NPDC007808 TaxID=3364779 RepID=UPI0036B59A52